LSRKSNRLDTGVIVRPFGVFFSFSALRIVASVGLNADVHSIDLKQSMKGEGTARHENENEAQNDQFPLSTLLFCLIDLLGRRKQGIA
jgi:hypothetical protein